MNVAATKTLVGGIHELRPGVHLTAAELGSQIRASVLASAILICRWGSIEEDMAIPALSQPDRLTRITNGDPARPQPASLAWVVPPIITLLVLAGRVQPARWVVMRTRKRPQGAATCVLSANG